MSLSTLKVAIIVALSGIPRPRSNQPSTSIQGKSRYHEEHNSENPIAERRILVRTLPVDVGPCGAGRYLHLKLVIFNVIVIFLERLDLVKPQMTRKTHFAK